MSAESLERPGLVGPRDETVDDIVGPLGESRHEVIDRPLWRKSDGKMVDPPREPRNEEDVGPLGESSDDEDVGPWGESRDDEELDPLEESSDEDDMCHFKELRDEDRDGLPQVYEEEEEVASPENLDELLQLAATSVSMLSRVPTNTGDASSSHATTTLPTKPQGTLTSFPSPLASTLTTSSRKRGRDSEDDTQDGESSPQQKRVRMDDILGIVRQDVQSAEVPQSVDLGMSLDRQRCPKRARSLEDDSEDIVTKPAPKRARLDLPVNENGDEEEENFTADHGGITKDDEPSLVHQEAQSKEVTEQAMFNGNPPNSETEESEDNFADDEASSTEIEWDTAHGINSTCANIVFPENGVYDVTGAWRHLWLPTSMGSPDRAWTEEEKEDLRVYIQDYGLQDWELLSQSTNRPEKELQSMYLEVITARNKQAGRPDRAGVTPVYPNLTPPPPPESTAPPTPAASPTPVVTRKLRSHGQRGRPNKKNRLGDLTYDVRATTFPKITRDGGMVDAKGNPLYGVMDDISYATKRRQPRPKQEDHISLPSAEDSGDSVADQSEEEESDSEIDSEINSEIEEGKDVDPAEQDREQAPSPEAVSKEMAPLDLSVEEEGGPEIKQEEDSDQEQGVSAPTAPAAKTNAAKTVLGPKFAGVCKLSGSSRRGVPRKAARLRKYSPG